LRNCIQERIILMGLSTSFRGYSELRRETKSYLNTMQTLKGLYETKGVILYLTGCEEYIGAGGPASSDDFFREFTIIVYFCTFTCVLRPPEESLVANHQSSAFQTPS